MDDDVVMVEIPVSREAAAALADADRRRRVGRFVSGLVEARPSGDDPLMTLFAQITRQARAAGLTDDAIDAELAAYNAERRN